VRRIRKLVFPLEFEGERFESKSKKEEGRGEINQ
jgi:hypothetical protein